MIGKTISHYHILEELGRGGMGIVYKAQDTKLKRTVALKFLPPELTRDTEAKERFIREAQAASSLDHPNVCTIHEIGETPGESGEGQLFIVMACYQGQTLRDTIRKGEVTSPLTFDDATDYAIQIGQGLHAAHEKGIVHRDIKPANILITDDGIVKILDFGLAKLSGQTHITKDGSTLGTVAYMSPEQVGSKEIDQRTDIWSLGVLFYEMLTGDLPFKGDYDQAVIYAILNDEPQTLLNNDQRQIPNELERILWQMLNKNVQERYVNVEDFLIDLVNLLEEGKPRISKSKSTKTKKVKQRLIYITSAVVIFLAIITVRFIFFPTSESQGAIRSLAVLPFYNIKGDPQTDFLSFALADQIIGKLIYLKKINVRSSSSIRPYEGQKVDAIKVGKELDVDYILAGNYLKEKDDIRLNIEFIKTKNNELLWRKPINIHYENAFQLQDLVSQEVVQSMSVSFSNDERMRLRSDMPSNPLAYEYYLRAISYPLSVEGHTLAIQMLHKSLKLDSTHAPTFVELGRRSHWLANYATNEPEDFNKAEQYYLKALALNSEQLDAISNLAGYYTDIGRIDEAIKLAHRALEINPNNAWTHFTLSYIYRYAGMLKESVDEADKALELDPQNSGFRSLILAYIYQKDYQKAFKVSELGKGDSWEFAFKGAISLIEGHKDQAQEYLNKVLEIEPKGIMGYYAKGMTAFLEGNDKEGIQALQSWENSNPFASESLYIIAQSYALLNDQEGCIRILKKAIDGGYFNYPFMLRDPFLDSVRTNPDFQIVLALAKEKHEAFKQKYFSKE